jgi:flagellar hook-length control protein FliK
VPEIIPVAVSVPIAPASAPAPVAGVAPVAHGDFMGQLAAALKGLKGLVKATPGMPLQADGTLLTPVEGAQTAQDEATPADSKSMAAPDDIAELLATLGLTVVPTQASEPLLADAPAGSKGTPAPVAQLALAPDAFAAAPTQAPTPAEPVATDTTSTLAAAAAEPAKHAAAPMSQAAHTPEHALEVPTTEPQVSAQQQAVAQPGPSTQHPATEAPAAPHPQPQVPFGNTNDTAFQQSANGGGHSHENAGEKAEPLPAAAHPGSAVPERTYAETAGLAMPTAATAATQAPADVRAADVAAQIAQQVDLYRLPGNKGVRIQLHPEDLGGVQVTLRYAAGGSLELHISVEHAATGSLVQAGLSQLRDALATQGFQPDRVVMSITAPPSAGQMDFSGSGSNSGGGSYRPDAGLASFTQDGQSGQQPSGGNDQRGPRGWSGAADDAIGAADDSPRVASSTSVIDYRV